MSVRYRLADQSEIIYMFLSWPRFILSEVREASPGKATPTEHKTIQARILTTLLKSSAGM